MALGPVEVHRVQRRSRALPILLVAGGLGLAAGGGVWDEVWQRFREAPRFYPGLPRALRDVRRAAPAGPTAVAFDTSPAPPANEAAPAGVQADRAGVP